MQPSDRPRWYWEQQLPAPDKPFKRPPCADLAALRRAASCAPGTDLGVIRFQRAGTPDSLARVGLVSSDFAAEHHTLGLYATHQSGKDTSMHQPDVQLGAQVRRLHTSGQVSRDSVDRLMESAGDATSVRALVYALDTLVSLLRTGSLPVDYTQLYHAIRTWDWPDTRARTRVRWGLAYHAASNTKPTHSTVSEES